MFSVVGARLCRFLSMIVVGVFVIGSGVYGWFLGWFMSLAMSCVVGVPVIVYPSVFLMSGTYPCSVFMSPGSYCILCVPVEYSGFWNSACRVRSCMMSW